LTDDPFVSAIIKTCAAEHKARLPSDRTHDALMAMDVSGWSDEQLEAEYHRLYAIFEREWKQGFFSALSNHLVGEARGSA
jgi:hypothetical protein